MSWEKKKHKKDWKAERKRARARGKASARRGGSGSGLGSHGHDRECEMLTFLYVLGRGWGLLNAQEIGMVIEKIVEDPKWIDGTVALEDRVCACGLGALVPRGMDRGDSLRRMGENLGAVMYVLFGKLKARELQARIEEKDLGL